MSRWRWKEGMRVKLEGKVIWERKDLKGKEKVRKMVKEKYWVRYWEGKEWVKREKVDGWEKVK